MRSVEFALGLLARGGPAGVAAEDFDGPHGDVLRAWQDQGFVARTPGVHPAPGCPHCGGGVPYPVGGRLLCPRCRSPVDPRHLLLWPVDREAVLAAVAARLRLRAGVRAVDPALWQLGTGDAGGEAVECFYRSGPLSAAGRGRVGAYRRAVVFAGPAAGPEPSGPGFAVSALDLFGPDGSPRAADLAALLRPRGAVRFDPHSGAVWAGGAWLGEAPVGSREYHLLACLAERLDHYVPYADLRREVLRRSGGADEADAATFCHGLKRRLKARWVPAADRLLATTNKADGYRLRGYLAEL